MKPKPGWIDQWQTEADDNSSWWKFIAAFAVFVLLLIDAFLYVTALTP